MRLCDVCNKNADLKLYGSPFGPISLGYCEECIKHSAGNESTAILSFCESGEESRKGWIRHMENLRWKPTVYVNGEYISIKIWLEEHTDVVDTMPKINHGMVHIYSEEE